MVRARVAAPRLIYQFVSIERENSFVIQVRKSPSKIFLADLHLYLLDARVYRSDSQPVQEVRHLGNRRAMGSPLEFGAPGETRTPDLLVRSQPLYPTELRARYRPVYPDYGSYRPV